LSSFLFVVVCRPLTNAQKKPLEFNKKHRIKDSRTKYRTRPIHFHFKVFELFDRFTLLAVSFFFFFLLVCAVLFYSYLTDEYFACDVSRLLTEPHSPSLDSDPAFDFFLFVCVCLFVCHYGGVVFTQNQNVNAPARCNRRLFGRQLRSEAFMDISRNFAYFP
jgi:hypothetical protein